MAEKISAMTEKLESSNTELTPQEQYKNILEKALQSAILLNKIIRGKAVEEYTKEEIIEWVNIG